MKLRIIGCGNSDRGDDAAGLLVVRRLRALGVDADLAAEQGGDGLALIEQWAGCERVILIDATRSGASPGEIRIVDGVKSPLPAEAHSSTHGFGVREAVEMVRALGRLPSSLTIYGIEAVDFTPGAPVSEEVAQAVESVAQQLAVIVKAEELVPADGGAT